MTPLTMNSSRIDSRHDAAPMISRTATDDCASVDSNMLFQGARELIIDHGGNAYHLRITRNDKLILTK